MSSFNLKASTNAISQLALSYTRNVNYFEWDADNNAQNATAWTTGLLALEQKDPSLLMQSLLKMKDSSSLLFLGPRGAQRSNPLVTKTVQLLITHNAVERAFANQRLLEKDTIYSMESKSFQKTVRNVEYTFPDRINFYALAWAIDPHLVAAAQQLQVDAYISNSIQEDSPPNIDLLLAPKGYYGAVNPNSFLLSKCFAYFKILERAVPVAPTTDFPIPSESTFDASVTQPMQQCSSVEMQALESIFTTLSKGSLLQQMQYYRLAESKKEKSERVWSRGSKDYHIIWLRSLGDRNIVPQNYWDQVLHTAAPLLEDMGARAPTKRAAFYAQAICCALEWNTPDFAHHLLEQWLLKRTPSEPYLPFSANQPIDLQRLDLLIAKIPLSLQHEEAFGQWIATAGAHWKQAVVLATQTYPTKSTFFQLKNQESSDTLFHTQKPLPPLGAELFNAQHAAPIFMPYSVLEHAAFHDADFYNAAARIAIAKYKATLTDNFEEFIKKADGVTSKDFCQDKWNGARIDSNYSKRIISAQSTLLEQSIAKNPQSKDGYRVPKKRL